jgi:hypothetical protein
MDGACVMNNKKYRFIALERGGVEDTHTGKKIMPSDPEWRTVYYAALTEGALVTPPTTLPADQSVDEIKAILSSQIKDHATSLRNEYTLGQSSLEVASWYTKAGEARSIQSKPDSSFATLRPYAPTLCAETLAMNPSATQATLISELRNLAAAVLANHDPYLNFVNAVQATSKRHRDNIVLLSDKSTLVMYDWRTGWPEVQ